MTLSTFLQSLLPGSLAQAEVPVRDTAPTSLDAVSATALPASVLCARVSAKWVRRHRAGVEIRGGIDLAMASALGVPASRLVVHVECLSAADLADVAGLAVGHLVVSSRQHVAALPPTLHRPQHVLLRTADATLTACADRRGFDGTTLAQIIDHPLLQLAGLHADIGSREGAFANFPTAIGQAITEMADIRDRHDVVLSRVSVGVDAETAAGAVDLTWRAAHIDEALRDACRTYGFPLPSTIVSTAACTIALSAA